MYVLFVLFLFLYTHTYINLMVGATLFGEVLDVPSSHI